MSDLKAYRIDECGRMIEDSEPDEDSWAMWLSAQSEIAALREENRVLQSQLGDRWKDISALKTSLDRVSQSWHDIKQQSDATKQRLADAERRNAEWQLLLEECIDSGQVDGILEEDIQNALAALNPKPEAASHDE